METPFHPPCSGDCCSVPPDPVLATAGAEQLLLQGCSGGAAATGGGSLATRAEDGAPAPSGRQDPRCHWAWSTGGGFGAQGHAGEERGGPARCYFQSHQSTIYIYLDPTTLFSRCLGTRPFVLSQHGSGGLWVLFRFIFYIKDLFFIVKDARVGFFNILCMATDLDHPSLHPWGCPLGVGKRFLIPKLPSCLRPGGPSLSLQGVEVSSGHPSVSPHPVQYTKCR